VSKSTGPILITGGCGFIGSYVARILLSQGREAVAYDPQPLTEQTRHVLGDAWERYPYEEGGVEDWGRLVDVVNRIRPAAIIHGGAIVNTTWLFKHPFPAFQVNAGGTLNVLEAARVFDVARVLFISSIGVLPSVQYQPIDVNHPLILAKEGPGSGFYGAAKVASEAFGFCYKDAFGTDFRVVRPSAPYGFAMGWPMFVKPMVECAVRGEPVSFATGGPFPRSYTYIEDLASLIVAILDGPDDADRVFYGAHGGALTTAAEVAAIVHEFIPSADITIGDELSDSDQYELNFRAPLSVENAREQLGWVPRYTDMREGIAEYIERYREFVGSHTDNPVR
jgi:UDP-glucose 4-epimerase